MRARASSTPSKRPMGWLNCWRRRAWATVRRAASLAAPVARAGREMPRPSDRLSMSMRQPWPMPACPPTIWLGLDEGPGLGGQVVIVVGDTPVVDQGAQADHRAIQKGLFLGRQSGGLGGQEALPVRLAGEQFRLPAHRARLQGLALRIGERRQHAAEAGQKRRGQPAAAQGRSTQQQGKASAHSGQQHDPDHGLLLSRLGWRGGVNTGCLVNWSRRVGNPDGFSQFSAAATTDPGTHVFSGEAPCC